MGFIFQFGVKGKKKKFSDRQFCELALGFRPREIPFVWIAIVFLLVNADHISGDIRNFLDELAIFFGISINSVIFVAVFITKYQGFKIFIKIILKNQQILTLI